MKKSKVIYDNGISKYVVEYGGDMVRIVQSLDGDIISDIILYADEFEEIVDFVNESKIN